MSAGTAPVVATEYYARRTSAAGAAATNTLAIGTTEVSPAISGDLRGKSVQISVRKTTAAGTGTLRGRVIYEKWV